MFHRLDRNLCSPFVGKMEHACGYAAEGDALEASLLCEVKTRTIALCQLFFFFLRWVVITPLALWRGVGGEAYDGANGVNDVLGWQIIAIGHHGFARFQESALQLVITLLSELDACSRVDAVVDAVV